jgi:hypothetical protein
MIVFCEIQLVTPICWCNNWKGKNITLTTIVSITTYYFLNFAVLIPANTSIHACNFIADIYIMHLYYYCKKMVLNCGAVGCLSITGYTAVTLSCLYLMSCTWYCHVTCLVDLFFSFFYILFDVLLEVVGNNMQWIQLTTN